MASATPKLGCRLNSLPQAQTFLVLALSVGLCDAEKEVKYAIHPLVELPGPPKPPARLLSL